MRRPATSPSAIGPSGALLLGLALGCAPADGPGASWAAEPSGGKGDALAPVDPADCPGGAPRLVGGRPAAWTVMHYAAADNDLEPDIVEDIQEMELGHQGSPNVNVVVQLDRESEPGTWRYEIRPDSDRDHLNSEVAGRFEEIDSGKPENLAAFGRWAVTCYPAEAYMLVIGGHGNGWSEPTGGGRASLRARARHERARAHGEALRVIAPDYTDGSEMYVSDVVWALERIRDLADEQTPSRFLSPLTLYGSDACLMQTVEVAYEMRNAVTYVVGSEEEEPGKGWPYSTFVRELTRSPVYYLERPALLARTIVEKYGSHYNPWGDGADEMHTLAAVDTGGIARAKHRVDRIADLLVGMLENEHADANPHLAEIIWTARHESYTFGDGYTDLGRFLELLREGLIAAERMPERRQHWTGDERARDLRDTIDELLLDVWRDLVVPVGTDRDTGELLGIGRQYPGAKGLSIYFPTDSCSFFDPELYAESAFGRVSAWDELVRTMVADFPEGGGAPEARGEGTGAVDFDGQRFEEVTLDCQLKDGQLYVSSFGGECASGGDSCGQAPSINFYASVSGLRMTHTSTYAIGVDFELERWDLAEAIADGEVEPGRRYAGTVAARLDDGRRLELAFDCNALRSRVCR